ncbi:MAG TPA: glycoside hydrolase family 73 protein, partial [Streptosporangiaceae bacterium]|nr:glycoside hydrolase family 73 protein [Streptosporangiaceae bacterium]
MSLSTCGTVSGFTVAHDTLAEMTSPAGLPAHLLTLDKPAAAASRGDGALRSAIVSVARHYLQLARTRTPAEMEALIWQVSSVDGADHGQSCAAFASLTLALGAQAAGQQSWVTGGGSYPWPLHRWADVRVQPNPASPDVVSMLTDARAHHRWHPLGDGYRAQPGDWVLFDGHVEVVTRLAGSALYTVGGDSLPDLTVNAHRFPAPFGAVGVLGFVNNGDLDHRADRAAGGGSSAGDGPQAGGSSQAGGGSQAGGDAAIPGVLADAPREAAAGPAEPAYRRHDEQPAGVPGTAAQQAFISLVAPGAMAAQQRYGIPAAVTIAQAIDESGWGRSVLATADHNLFGIKGAGPAGRDMLPTREHENGVWVTRTAPFRVYHNVAESIEDHGRLLATDPAYRHAMASRGRPDAFATALTGVYATDPGYGSSLIALMRLYNLYRYDTATPSAALPAGAPAGPAAGVSAEPRVGGQRAVVPGIPEAAGSASRDGIPGVAGALAVGAMRARPARSGRRGEQPALRRRGGEQPARHGQGGEQPARRGERPGARIAPRGPLPTPRRYVARIPYPVAADFVATAKGPLTRAQPLYQDVADRTGIGWELLAACDWMQCQARSRYSPGHGEKLGTVNPDGTMFRTRSAALAQCASELIELAGAVYQISLPAGRALSVRELANVFAAFRWGGL